MCRAGILLPCLAAVVLLAGAAQAESLPAAIGRQLPSGYRVLEVAHGRLTEGKLDDYLVILGRSGDDPDAPAAGDTTPARPLLLFRARPDGVYALAGRNDHVVMRHSDGGQCDPFDPELGLVVKRHYVTVQNAVACGAHWSDYITFRYDRRRDDLVFDSEIYHAWKFNQSEAPDAEALVPDGPPVVTRADPHHPVVFSSWRPSP